MPRDQLPPAQRPRLNFQRLSNGSDLGLGKYLRPNPVSQTRRFRRRDRVPGMDDDRALVTYNVAH